MRKILITLFTVALMSVGMTAVAQPAGQSLDTSAAAAPTEPGPNTPVNPKIVKGKAGSGFFDPTAPGYAAADPGVAAAGTSTMAAAAFDPAPYSTLRWATTPEDANGHPWICISNNIGDAWQDRVIAWDYMADQLTYTYQINGCSGWGNNEKIDIEVGTNSARACAYVYKAWNTAGQLTRVIVYHNHAIAGCHTVTNPTNELSVRHWKSQVIGLGLGNLQYGAADRPNWGLGVMDMASESYLIPDPERGDGLTYDWYN